MFGGNLTGDDYKSNDFSGTQVGAGFMNSPGIANKTQSRQPSRRNEQSLMPLTIKQITGAKDAEPDSPLTIDGREVSNVKIMGVVSHIETQTTNTSITISDGTDEIVVKVWSSEDSNQSALTEDFEVNTLIQVIGRISTYRNIRTVTGYSVKSVPHENDYTLHLLEAAYFHKVNLIRMKKQEQGMNTTMNSTGGYPTGMVGGVMNTGVANNAMNSSFNNAFAQMGDDSDEFSALEQKIFAVLRKQTVVDSDEGAHCEEIFTALADEDINEIREAIDNLVTNGHVYTTTDDEHYKMA